jgi:hypothetical protein
VGAAHTPVQVLLLLLLLLLLSQRQLVTQHSSSRFDPQLTLNKQQS